MAGGSPVFYWDTCLFLAWLKDEPRAQSEMDGVREVIERHKRREVKIITSTITRIEILNSKFPVGVDSLFSDLLKRITRLSVDTKIAAVAHDIRDYYSSRTADNNCKTLSTPDAIHLATAILYRANAFHTFDQSGDARSLGLLPLSGNVGGHNLEICIPSAQSPQLDLRHST